MTDKLSREQIKRWQAGFGSEPIDIDALCAMALDSLTARERGFADAREQAAVVIDAEYSRFEQHGSLYTAVMNVCGILAHKVRALKPSPIQSEHRGMAERPLLAADVLPCAPIQSESADTYNKYMDAVARNLPIHEQLVAIGQSAPPGTWENADRVMVPREPTKEMMEAWHRGYERGEWNADSWDSAFSVAYKAMLAALPASQSDTDK